MVKQSLWLKGDTPTGVALRHRIGGMKRAISQKPGFLIKLLIKAGIVAEPRFLTAGGDRIGWSEKGDRSNELK